MRDVTDRVATYRDCLRDLWNTHFADEGDWDSRALFENAATYLFRAMVLYDVPHDARDILPSHVSEQHFLSFLKVTCLVEVGVVISKEASFRQPLDPSASKGICALDMSYIDLWDSYPLAHREFAFICAEIVDATSSLLGSRVLIPFGSARVFVRNEI